MRAVRGLKKDRVRDRKTEGETETERQSQREKQKQRETGTQRDHFKLKESCRPQGEVALSWTLKERKLVFSREN